LIIFGFMGALFLFFGYRLEKKISMMNN